MLQPVLLTRKVRCPLIGQKLQFRKWTSSNGKWTTTKRIHVRIFFHGKRGELRQRYREGQDDQLGALGLVVDMIVLWNTLYMQAAIDQLRAEGYPVDEDIPHLSPPVHDHINMPGRYSFWIPDSVSRGELRPLRNPSDPGP